MKQELEAYVFLFSNCITFNRYLYHVFIEVIFAHREYLATFKKTVAMHEAFLTRLASHPVFRNDHNFRVFLEYDQDLAVRSKNKTEILEVSIVKIICI